MKRKFNGLILTLLATLFGAIGCQTRPFAHAHIPEKCAVFIEGCGRPPTAVPISAERRTLRDALEKVIVDPVLNAGGYPVLIFAHLNRPEGEYYVATELIPDTAAGDILLNPGEKIELVPWTETDLMRGLKQVKPSTVGPAPAYNGDLFPLLEWYARLPKLIVVDEAFLDRFKAADDVTRIFLLNSKIDNDIDLPATTSDIARWYFLFVAKAINVASTDRPMLVYQPEFDYLQGLYDARLKGPNPVELKIVGLDASGRNYPELVKARISSEMLSEFGASNAVRRIALLTSIPQGEAESVGIVERSVDGRAMSFMLPIPNEPKKPKKTELATTVKPATPIQWDALQIALVYDGDVLTAAPAENFPLVQASQLVSKNVVRPMVERRKLAQRLLAKP